MTPRPATKPEESFRDHYKVIAPLIMGEGVGDGKTTSCVMAQAATIDALRKGKTLNEPTDEMDCACPVLRRIAIRLNDTNWWKDNAERTEVLRPLIPLLLDSRGSLQLLDRRGFMVADQVVRVLTPMRLEWIAKHTKSKQVKKDISAGKEKLRALAEIVDKASALAARDVCEGLRASASASAYASASASAYASASADAYAYADADAYAYAYADSYAYADAYAYAQKVKYRTACLDLFHKLAALTEATRK